MFGECKSHRQTGIWENLETILGKAAEANTKTQTLALSFFSLT